MDEQNNFVNIVDSINKLARKIINRCGKEWADQAFSNGIITFYEKEELKALLEKRDNVCHGKAGIIQITTHDVQKAQEYLDIMKTTSKYFVPKQNPQPIKHVTPQPKLPNKVNNNGLAHFDWQEYMRYMYSGSTGKPPFNDPWLEYMRKMYNIPSNDPNGNNNK